MARVDAKMLPISKETLVKEKSIEEGKAAVMVAYVQNKYRCRSSFLARLFWRRNQFDVVFAMCA